MAIEWDFDETWPSSSLVVLWGIDCREYGDMIWHDWETLLDGLTKGSGLALLCPPGLLRIQQQPTIHGIPTNHGSGAYGTPAPFRQFLTKHLSQPHEFQELEIFKYQIIPNGIWCLDILSTTPIHSYPSLHRNHLNQMDLRLPLGCKLSWRPPSRASRVSLLENQGTIRCPFPSFWSRDHRTKWGDDPATSGSQFGLIRRVVRGRRSWYLVQ